MELTRLRSAHRPDLPPGAPRSPTWPAYRWGSPGPAAPIAGLPVYQHLFGRDYPHRVVAGATGRPHHAAGQPAAQRRPPRSAHRRLARRGAGQTAASASARTTVGAGTRSAGPLLRRLRHPTGLPGVPGAVSGLDRGPGHGSPTPARRSESARLAGPVRRDRRFPDLPHPVGRRGEEPGLERLRDRHRGRTRPVGTQPHRPQRTTGLLVRGAAAQRLGVRRLRGPGIRRHPAGAGGEAAAPIPPPILATGVRLLRDGARPARPTGPLGQLQRRAPAGDRDRAPPGGAAGRRPVVRARHVQRLGHPHPVRPAPG